MRVDPSTNAQSPIALSQADAATSRSTAKTSAASGSANGAGTFVMTDKLAQLLASVRSAPDVRPEAVASASAKLASGELDTPQAAADTAKALLNDEQPTGK